jgi:hypothetical protein
MFQSTLCCWGFSSYFFDGRLSSFFNIFSMLQTLNFDIADVEF